MAVGLAGAAADGGSAGLAGLLAAGLPWSLVTRTTAATVTTAAAITTIRVIMAWCFFRRRR
jgi:hypothetical protein